MWGREDLYDEPARSHSLINYTDCSISQTVFAAVNSEDSDQNAIMRSLIRVFTDRTLTLQGILLLHGPYNLMRSLDCMYLTF